MVVLTAGSPAYFPPKICVQDILEVALYPGGDGLDAELGEVFEGSRPHAPGDHYLSILFFDELGHCTGDVTVEIGVVDNLYIRCGVVLDVHNRIVGAPSKMSA